METILETQEEQPQLAVATAPRISAQDKAAEAKVDAIAALTHAAYSKASQLDLADSEIKRLAAEFPDEAFKPGAAGKENLIYIEHAFLRDRLNEIFRPGQWAIVPRNRWNENFKTARGIEACRVYVEAMLVIRGCFAAEAVGEMEYYPNNAGQNYGDAVEGAKTAALRRCCKELGIGLQAWKKDWCEGWWDRRNKARRKPAHAPERDDPIHEATKPVKTPPSPVSAPKQAAHNERHIAVLRGGNGTDAEIEAALDFGVRCRTKFLAELAKLGEKHLAVAWLHAFEEGHILVTEGLHDLPPRWAPLAANEFRDAMDGVRDSLEVIPESDLVTLLEDYRKVNKPLSAKPVEEWRTFPMPFGQHAGVALEDLDKKYLFGLWANHTVETEYNGKPKAQTAIIKDEHFRQMLDQAGEHYQFKK